MLTRPAVLRVAMLILPVLVAAHVAWANVTPAGPDASPTRAPAFFERSDIAFALVSTAAVAVTAHHDLALRRRAIAADSPFYRNLANATRPFGNTGIVLPALIAGYALARLEHSPAAQGFAEVGVSVAAASLGTLIIKEAVGRVRPEDSPGDSRLYHPFSGNNSFPSGHASVAFALAESIGRTSGRRWVPFLTYPVATVVAWSRVRDDDHWTSDVVAGTALGIWTAHKVHRMWPAEKRLLSRFGITLHVTAGAHMLAVTVE